MVDDDKALVEVLSEAGYTYLEVDELRAALAKRGLEIREAE